MSLLNNWIKNANINIMKNYLIVASVFGLMLLTSPFIAKADEVATSTDPVVVEEVVAPTTISQSGGFMSACWYIKFYDTAPCVDSPALQHEFLFSPAAHEYTLSHWRIAIFGR